MPHKLLLADDSVTIQRVIELTFADEDIQVIAVGDGKQAIDRVQTEHPDIVLADVGMPERDGYEVASFIKGNPQLAHIPVLLLTGAFEPIDEARARGVGCDGVLVKPFEPQMVINRVKDLLAGKRPAGLWALNPAAPAQPPVRPVTGPAADLDLKRATPQLDPGAPPADTLDVYFDRLDAAFATVGGETPARPAAPVTSSAEAPRESGRRDTSAPPEGLRPGKPDVDTWDPELTGDPARPARPGGAPAGQPVPPRAAESPRPAPSAIAPTPIPVSVSAPIPSPGTSAPAPGQSATALPSLAEAFAALLGAEQGQAVAPSTSAASPADHPDMVEDIVRRVIERMGDQAVQRTVLDVAERLVREEIERIKAKA
jgi:CheY-like chemotaxis protein